MEADLEHGIARVLSEPSRREFLIASASFAAASLPGLYSFPAQAALQISDAYSPRNQQRMKRKSTRYIILHTTEAPDKSSFEMVKRLGLANYLIHTDGTIKRIIEAGRLARHAGRSMWGGQENLDSLSIGIELVGYHDKPLEKSQYFALRELLIALKKEYGVQDRNILPHSMVAYGSANRWYPAMHRGRKRCGMEFSDHAIRKLMGLGPAPSYDPDVRAGRLIVADTYLNDRLFGAKASRDHVPESPISSAAIADTLTAQISAYAIARDRYNSRTTRYTFPNGTVLFGDKITDWGKLPLGTKVALDVGETIPQDVESFQTISGNDTAWKVAGKEFNSPYTIYFYPNGMVRRGDEISRYDLDHIPRGTQVLTGYNYGGMVTQVRSPNQIAGIKWNDPGTLYRMPDAKIVSGDDINPSHIPPKTLVFFRKG